MSVLSAVSARLVKKRYRLRASAASVPCQGFGQGGTTECILFPIT